MKIIDPNGEMLETTWEPIATELANISDDEILNKIDSLKRTYCQSPTRDFHTVVKPHVIIGRDTRYSVISDYIHFIYPIDQILSFIN